MDDTTRNITIKQLDDVWHVAPRPHTTPNSLLSPAKAFVSTATYQLIGSLIEQQNACNAALVHACQALAASDDQRQNELQNQLHNLQVHLQNFNVQVMNVVRRAELIEQHLADIDAAETALAARLVQLELRLNEREATRA